MTFVANITGHFEDLPNDQVAEKVRPALETLAEALRDAGASGTITFEGKHLTFFPGDNLAWD